MNRLRVLLACSVLVAAAGVLGFGDRWWSHNRSAELTPTEAGAEAVSGERERDRPGDALAWRRLSLQDENGVIAEGGLMRARAQADAMRAARPDGGLGAGIGRGTWTSVGPGNIGGRIRAIVIHPTTPATMLVGSVSGGIWRTTNAGATWAPVQDFMTNLAVTSIVMKPGTPDEIYAATGEGFNNFDSIRGEGIFKSVDGGLTWAQLPATSTAPAPNQATDFHYVNRLAMSPDGTTLLAATRAGVFVSGDGGTTFAAATLNAGCTPGSGFMDIDFHPTNSQLAIVSSDDALACFSTDGGANWTVATGLPGSMGGQTGRVEVAYAPSNPATVYASVDENGGALYRSTDGGQSYALLFDGAVDMNDPLSNQGFYDNVIWVSPTTDQDIIWGGVDLWRSTTGGATGTFARISRWQEQTLTGPTSAHADHHAIVAHPGYNGTTNRTVYFGNDGGLYRADDLNAIVCNNPGCTTGWTKLNNGLAITQLYGASGHPGTGRLASGTQDNGSPYYDPTNANPSESWIEAAGGDGGFSAYDPTDQNVFYGEYPNLEIHRNDGVPGTGTSQTIAEAANQNGLLDSGNNDRASFISPFILDPTNANRLLAGGISLWRTNNAKATPPTFEQIKGPVGGTLVSNGAVLISAIAVAPGNADIAFVGHDDGRVYKTMNATAAAGAIVWTTIDDNQAGTNPLPNRRVTRLTVHPADPNTVFATFGGFSSDNIWMSVNGGATWSSIAAGLPQAPVRDLDVHPNQATWLYAATEVGIFTSENSGATWIAPHDGPSNVSVDELFFLNTTLVAATHGRGVFTTPTSASATAPTISAIANLTVVAGVGGTANFTIADPDTPLANLTLSGASSNTAVVPNNTIVFGGTGGNRTVTVTPPAGVIGMATVTVTVSDGTEMATSSFTVTVQSLPAVGTPTNLHVISMEGNTVTFGWEAGVGQMAATNHLIEGGVNPGDVAASLPTGSETSAFTLVAPTGAFYVRVRAVAGSVTSANSNEIRIFVNVPAPPSAPASVLGLVDGSTVSLSWSNTYGGGTPDQILLDVTGAVATTLPLGLTEGFSFAGVPAGTYTLSLRATNAGGSSPASNALTLTFPGACSGAPLVPANFIVGRSGNLISVYWDPPANGPAPTTFVLNVTGAFVGSFPTAGQALSGVVGPGSYTLSVMATNACGNGPFTAAQTVVVP